MSDLEMIFPARNLNYQRFPKLPRPAHWIDRDPKHQGPLASSHWSVRKAIFAEAPIFRVLQLEAPFFGRRTPQSWFRRHLQFLPFVVRKKVGNWSQPLGESEPNIHGRWVPTDSMSHWGVLGRLPECGPKSTAWLQMKDFSLVKEIRQPIWSEGQIWY